MSDEAPRPGRHHLDIPGPTPIPDAVTRAMARPLIDHRGPEFARLTRSILERLGPVFGCRGPIAVYPSSGTGAWEAALVNTLSSGDQVLCCDNGHFARQWGEVARRLGLTVERLGCDWRHPVDPGRLEERLAADADGRAGAVLALHNETSTGTLSDIAALRGAIDGARHAGDLGAALFLLRGLSPRVLSAGRGLALSGHRKQRTCSRPGSIWR